MRILICLLSISSTALFAANSAPVAPTPSVQPVAQSIHSTQPLQIDERKWKVGHEATEEGRLIREYVLDNEDATAWTELFSIQQFNDVPVAPQEFFKLFVDGLKQAVPQNKVESRVISDTPDVLLGEWWVHDKSQNDQHEWIKIFKEGDEILIVRYTTKKVDDVEAIRKKWETILTNFKAKKEA